MQTSQRIHIALPVSNLSESTAFYEQLFGQPPTKRREDYAKFEASQPAVHLALNLTSQNIEAQRDPYHFGIQLASQPEFEALSTRIRASGLAGEEEQEVTCCYAVSNKLWLRDPDGHRWELFHSLSDAATHGHEAPMMAGEPATTDESSRSCCAPTCCTS